MIESKEEFNWLVGYLTEKEKANELGKDPLAKLEAYREVENLININKIYLVVLVTGCAFDQGEENIFSTTDKTKADKWVERFNKIIKDNEHRLKNSDEYLEKSYFWQSFVNYNDPVAVIQEVEIR